MSTLTVGEGSSLVITFQEKTPNMLRLALLVSFHPDGEVI
jgi:hypothetical protein